MPRPNLPVLFLSLLAGARMGCPEDAPNTHPFQGASLVISGKLALYPNQSIPMQVTSEYHPFALELAKGIEPPTL